VEPAAADLLLLTLSGAQVRDLLEQALAGDGTPDVHLAGATVRYDPKARAGRRVKSIALAGGRKFKTEDAYSLVTDHVSAAGGGGLTVLRGLLAERLGLIDIEAVAGYLRRLPQPVEFEGTAAFHSTRR
jgi:2',3'-cyclic-nucleotide 2'-phosphodiesterase (5'-nucleotidase family)